MSTDAAQFDAARLAEALAISTEIGRTYNAVPYDPRHGGALDLALIRGAAAANGLALAADGPLDVLDIGCGAGGMLQRAATQSAGRMVGVDIASDACAGATQRGAAFGPRWQIINADATLLDPHALGRFDVVYLVGTLFIAPEQARARLLDLLAGCLKPGGTAVITGYTGIFGLVRTRLGRLLRAENDPALPIPTQIARVRANLDALTGVVPSDGPSREVVLAALQSMRASPDDVLFHEALGPIYAPLHTAEIAVALARHGLVFLNYLTPAPLDPALDSATAARAADAWDFTAGGGYRTMLFARPAAGPPAGDMRHPAIAWTTSLRRLDEAIAPDGSVGYAEPNDGPGLRTASPMVHAMLDAMAAAPAAWPDLAHAVRTRLATASEPEPDDLDAAIKAVLRTLWQSSMILPFWRGSA